MHNPTPTQRCTQHTYTYTHTTHSHKRNMHTHTVHIYILIHTLITTTHAHTFYSDTYMSAIFHIHTRIHRSYLLIIFEEKLSSIQYSPAYPVRSISLSIFFIYMSVCLHQFLSLLMLFFSVNMCVTLSFLYIF